MPQFIAAVFALFFIFVVWLESVRGSYEACRRVQGWLVSSATMTSCSTAAIPAIDLAFSGKAEATSA
jgi:hypothetical protein